MLPASLDPEHVFDEDVYPSGSVDACPAWDDMAGMMVGHEAGGIIALGARKASEKAQAISCHGLSEIGSGWRVLKGTFRGRRALADVAVLYEPINVALYPWPIVAEFQELQRLGSPWVASD